MKIVLLAGLKGSGKNTVANFLQERLEQNGRKVKQFALADELRRLMSILNPIVGYQYDADAYGCICHGVELEKLTYNQAIEAYGYDKAKFKFPEMRRLLQVFGSDVARDQISDTIWVDQLVKQLHVFYHEGGYGDEHEKVALVTDVRFDNESYGICEYASEVDAEVHGMLVTRPGLVSDGHQSERPEQAFNHPCLSDDGYEIIEYEIENNGTIDELRDYCYALADEDLA